MSEPYDVVEKTIAQIHEAYRSGATTARTVTQAFLDRIEAPRVLRHLPAETAHRVGFWPIRAAAGVPGLAWALHRLLRPRDPSLRVRALGLDFPGPLGLAAGFDKNAEVPAALLAMRPPKPDGGAQSIPA